MSERSILSYLNPLDWLSRRPKVGVVRLHGVIGLPWPARGGGLSIGSIAGPLEHCAYRKSNSRVAMMQPTDHGLSNDPAKTLDGATDRCVLLQRQMGAGLVVVAGVHRHDTVQMCPA